MANASRKYEFRCPIYGFIELSECERAIIEEPAFQRLRRIRQLALTDYVYPGAMHTRFEHSLGVMHMATLLFDNIVRRSKSLLLGEGFGYDVAGLERSRQLVRFAALLHDVGHAPFSHAGEDLFPYIDGDGKRYKHEHYSAAIVRNKFSDAIDGHDLQGNHGYTAEDVALFLERSSTLKNREILWRDLIDGQMDADRMDYLLRDSHHTGVSYGKYDWQRLVNTVKVVPNPDGDGYRFGVSEGGWHAAESLILARYYMFTQVYYHKTRVAYDHHLKKALLELMDDKPFPAPIQGELDQYLKWDDWRVLGLVANGEGGDHVRRLKERDHYRMIYHTPEAPSLKDHEILGQLKQELGPLLASEELSSKSWYKATIGQEIIVESDIKSGETKPLTEYSKIVKNLPSNNKIFLYALPENKTAARKIVEEFKGEFHE